MLDYLFMWNLCHALRHVAALIWWTCSCGFPSN